MKQKTDGTQENALVVKTAKERERERNQPGRGVEKVLHHFCFPQINIFNRLATQQIEVKAY